MWTDDRLMFKNLNMEDPELNSLSTEEYSQVWKPAIRFLNKEPNSKARKKNHNKTSSMIFFPFFPVKFLPLFWVPYSGFCLVHAF
jgi:hypothetical protein